MMEFEITHEIPKWKCVTNISQPKCIYDAFIKFSDETLEIWMAKMEIRTVAQIFRVIFYEYEYPISMFDKILPRLKKIMYLYKKYFNYDGMTFGIYGDLIYMFSNGYGQRLTLSAYWNTIAEKLEFEKHGDFYTSKIL